MIYVATNGVRTQAKSNAKPTLFKSSVSARGRVRQHLPNGPALQRDYPFNFFTGNSLQPTFSSPVYHMAFPPLTWHSEAQQVHTPEVAQGYTVSELE